MAACEEGGSTSKGGKSRKPIRHDVPEDFHNFFLGGIGFFVPFCAGFVSYAFLDPVPRALTLSIYLAIVGMTYMFLHLGKHLPKRKKWYDDKYLRQWPTLIHATLICSAAFLIIGFVIGIVLHLAKWAVWDLAITQIFLT